MRFEIRQSKRNKQWRAYFIGGNNEKIWWTEQYPKLHRAQDAVAMLNERNHTPFDVLVYDFTGRLREEY